MRLLTLFYLIFTFPSFAGYRPDRDGAEANVGIAVVDVAGNPIPDAHAKFKFYTTFDDYYFIESRTDAAGKTVARGNTRGEVSVIVQKDGFYYTKKDLKYRKNSWEKSVATKKWSDSVVENKIVLKPIVAPIQMPLYSVRFRKPPRDGVPMPYDFIAKDWCSPYGKGKVNDVDVEFFQTPNTNRVGYIGMRLNFSNCVDGVYEEHVDDWSRYGYKYVADTNAIYKKSIEVRNLPMHKNGSLIKKGPSDKKYYVVRFRTETNNVGRVVFARYGVISDGLDCMGGLNISVSVNPNENDINLENDWAYKNMMREKRRQQKRGRGE